MSCHYVHVSALFICVNARAYMCIICMCVVCAHVWCIQCTSTCGLCCMCVYSMHMCCVFITYAGECVCVVCMWQFSIFTQIYSQEVKEKMCHYLWRMQPQIKQIKNNLSQVVRENVEGFSKREGNLLGNHIYICIACFRIKTKKPKHIHTTRS